MVFSTVGLAGAVGAQQRDDAAARHFEADASDGHDRPIIALDIAELEDDAGALMASSSCAQIRCDDVGMALHLGGRAIAITRP